MRSVPWSLAKQRSKEHYPTEDEICQQILNITSLQEASFCAILYLTFGRIHEILNYKYKGYWKDEVEKNQSGLKINDFRREGDRWMVIIMRVQKGSKVKADIRKRRDASPLDYQIFLAEKKKSLDHKTRTMPVLIRPNSWELKLFELIDSYFDHRCPVNKLGIQDKNIILWPFTYARGRNICVNNLNLNPHSIRHIRVTHLVKKYNLSAKQLQILGGWSSPMMPMRYVDSSLGDIKEKMLFSTIPKELEQETLESEEQKFLDEIPVFEDKLDE